MNLRDALAMLCSRARPQLDLYERALEIEENIRPQLRRIEKVCLRHGYVFHGIRHSHEVERKLGQLIPEWLLAWHVLGELPEDAFVAEEVFLLVVASLCHDLGMIDPTRRSDHNVLSANLVFDKDIGKSKIEGLPSNLASLAADLCYAHRDYHDGQEFHRTLYEIPAKRELGGKTIRLPLLAALLRLADELDTEYSRAPEDVMGILTLTDEDANYWVSCQLIDSVQINWRNFEIRLVPFYGMVDTSPIFEKLVLACRHKIQQELNSMFDILKIYPKYVFPYSRISLEARLESVTILDV